MRHRVSSAHLFEEETPPPRLCDHPDCGHAGEYRAPRSRERLQDYYWFCLDHVREYNRTWNYYAGLSDTQVEQLVRHDTVWQRPTWPLGGWRAREDRVRDRVRDEYFADEPPGRTQDGRENGGRAGVPPRPPSEREQALAAFDLSGPVDRAAIKARYKQLVKLHHPDANGGCREAEEKLKHINRAYSVLKLCYPD